MICCESSSTYVKCNAATVPRIADCESIRRFAQPKIRYYRLCLDDWLVRHTFTAIDSLNPVEDGLQTQTEVCDALGCLYRQRRILVAS